VCRLLILAALPTGSNRTFHAAGEVGVARAASVDNHLQILSSGATTSVEETTVARGASVWFQVYLRKWEVTEALVKRDQASRSPVLVVTVVFDGLKVAGREVFFNDGSAPTNWETFMRLRRTDARQCEGCRLSSPPGYVASHPDYD
jgi:isopentenyl diphosphate isomerase/L-lactate dehydrogenase-like FMN-dependent dehydrogenase